MSADTPSDGGRPPGPPAFATNHEKPPDGRESQSAAAPRLPKSPNRFRQAVQDIRNTASAAVKGAVNGLTGSPRKTPAKAPKKRAPSSDDDASGSDDDGTARSTTPTPANKRARRSHMTTVEDDAAFFAEPHSQQFTVQELGRVADSARAMQPELDEEMADAHHAPNGMEQVDVIQFEDFNALAKGVAPSAAQEGARSTEPHPDKASRTGAEHDDMLVDREAVEDVLDAVLIDVTVATLTAYPELIEAAASAHRSLGRVLAQLPPNSTNYKPEVDASGLSSQLAEMAATLDALKAAFLAPPDTPATGDKAQPPKTPATASRFVPSANPIPIVPTRQTPATPPRTEPSKAAARRYNPARAILHPVVPLSQLERLKRAEKVADDIDAVNTALRDAASDARCPQVVGLTWTEAGNVVLVAADGFSGKELVSSSLVIGEALGLEDGFRAYENVEWHKATLRRVPTHGPGRRLLSDDDVLQQLKRNAPFNDIALVQTANPVRWLASPEARESARHSTLVVCMATAEDAAKFRALNKRLYVYGQECSTAAFEDRTPHSTCTNCWSVLARHRTRDCRSDSRCKFCAGPHHTESHSCAECEAAATERAASGMEVDQEPACEHIEMKCCNCGGNHPADYPWCVSRRPAVGSSATTAPMAGKPPRGKKPRGKDNKATHSQETEKDGQEQVPAEKEVGAGKGKETQGTGKEGGLRWSEEMEALDGKERSVRSKTSKASLAPSASSSAADAQAVDNALTTDDEGFKTVRRRKRRASSRVTSRTNAPLSYSLADKVTDQLVKRYALCPRSDILRWVRQAADEEKAVERIREWYAQSGIELPEGQKAFAPRKTSAPTRSA
ncbi:hypothetical protein EXIGLDRAFT_771291 [Exidia glandulosa HHB12029]|uniref:Uncharacterized protein n=1 Tax=Exidia glandulosa HHB12029 TaxID=1314781 RepID=A0A165G3D8_EXIGL|nr:hypothetical protein EXIGLDRAFT_771291 [Exidia glandulosa HHB12029]